MATKKKTRTTKSKSRSSKKPATRSRARKRGLSAGFNKANFVEALKKLLKSGAGGVAAPYANRAFSTIQNKWIRILVVGAVPAVAADMMGLKDVGSGFFGGMVALNTQNGLLSESMEEEFAEENVLAETPIFMSEDGVPLKMLEDGTLEELDEEEMAELEELMELQEAA